MPDTTVMDGYKADQYLNTHQQNFFFEVSPRWSKLLFHILPVGLSTGLLVAYTLGLDFLLGSDQVAFSNPQVFKNMCLKFNLYDPHQDNIFASRGT